MNSKPLILFQGPVRSRSGYGDHTRDLITSLIDTDKYDIMVAPTKWGDCPETALQPGATNDAIISRLLVGNNLKKQPDIFINCSVPNEWNNIQLIGKFNIGITAGIETTVCDPSWIEGCNKMNLVIVPSTHSRNVILNSTYDRLDSKTQKKVGDLKCERPVEVLFEGLNTAIYKQLSSPVESIDKTLSEVSESFCFLYVGHWLSGKLGHDRKDTGMMIKTFCETFKGKNNQPALIVKTSSATFSIIDRNDMIARIKGLRDLVGEGCPNVYLIHGDLTDEEINGLYNHPKVKAHLSFTKGEGFGRPLLEASVSGKPVIASNWSGHLDFLNPDFSTLLPGKLEPVHKSAQWKGVINEGSQWFYVNYKNAGRILRDVYKSYKSYTDGARKQAYLSRTEFSIEKMNALFINILDKYIKVEQAPVHTKLNLPKLKKIDDASAPPKLSLPKLKKV
jgi:glycosyltransferase involved in cell wall biosynthesis